MNGNRYRVSDQSRNVEGLYYDIIKIMNEESKKIIADAYGVYADPTIYAGQELREIREIIARTKDFFKCIIKPPASILGETIPVSGDGNITNDK